MELIEGETLADRIARGAVPVDEALNVAKQICEALEAAHEKRIIHRDLKPSNVKILPDGKVKAGQGVRADIRQHDIMLS
jgi:eukaryotic-like serine/threonine-protein kinase